MRVLLGVVLTVILATSGASPTLAVEVGEAAPEFRLPSTQGIEIALSGFRGKKWVFLEFYGGDFHPT